MTDTALLSGDLSDLVNQLFGQRLALNHWILRQIRDDIEGRQKLNAYILSVIDENIRKDRIRLRELETDAALWLHPRRIQVDKQLADWKKVRIEQLVLTAEHLLKLRREYREATKALNEAQRNRFLLQQVTSERYPPVPESNG